MKTNFLKKAFVLLLALIMVVPVMNGLEVKAAAKPTLSTKEMTIGIGSYGILDEVIGVYSKSQKYTLSVENSKKGATYTFTSGNKKIATVKKSGKKAYITGVKAGKTTITVKQKLKGKTTTVGKCTVTVKNACAYEPEWSSLSVGSAESNYIYISNFNPAAKYTYVCDDSNFSMTDARISDGEGSDRYYYGQKYTAKKPGTYVVTVKETYKKKTKSIGKVTLVVREASVEENMSLAVGEDTDLGYYISYYCTDGYWYEIKEDGILQDLDNGIVKAVATGTTTIDVWHYNAEIDGKGDFIGTINVVVTETSADDDYESDEDYEDEEW